MKHIFTLLLLLSLCFAGTSQAAMTGPWSPVMSDSQGTAAVTGYATPWQSPVASGNTGFNIDLTAGAAWLIDLSGVTHLGNPTGVSIFFTGYVEEFPTRHWIGVQQNSGNTASLVWTGVALYNLPSGVSMHTPAVANALTIWDIWVGIEGERGSSGSSVYPISGVTFTP